MDAARKQRVLSKLAGVFDRLSGADEVQKSIANAKKNYEAGGTSEQQHVNQFAATAPAGRFVKDTEDIKAQVQNYLKKGGDRDVNPGFYRNMVRNADVMLGRAKKEFTPEQLQASENTPGLSHTMSWKSEGFHRPRGK